MNNMNNTNTATSRILAKNIRMSNDTRVTRISNNDLIIGTIGRGKTTGYLIPNLLTATHSMVVSDTKRKLYKDYKDYLEKKGFEVYCLDFVHPDRSSCTYNPLAFIPRRVETIQDVEEVGYDPLLVKKVVNYLIPCEDTKDRYWYLSAQRVLTCLIAYAMETVVDEDLNMATVANLYKKLSAETNASLSDSNSKDNNVPGIRFLEEHAVKYPSSFCTEMYEMFKDSMKAQNTWGCIESFVTNALDIFLYRDCDRLFNGTSKFRFEDLGERKVILFVNTSDTDNSMRKYVELFYSQLFNELFLKADEMPDGRLPMPVRIVIDDFASNIQVPDFDKFIATSRSREVYVSIILQDIAQLNTYGSQKDAIISNFDNTIIMGISASALATANYYGDIMNKAPNAILNMPIDKAWLITSGKRPRLVDKIRPEEISNYMDTAYTCNYEAERRI